MFEMLVETVPQDGMSHSVPEDWRAEFVDIAAALAEGDYTLSSIGDPVHEVDEATATRIRETIEKYGATLAPLPEEAWQYAEAMWRVGDEYDVIVDLWTEEDGRSDLVLAATVIGEDSHVEIEVKLVYVP